MAHDRTSARSRSLDIVAGEIPANGFDSAVLATSQVAMLTAYNDLRVLTEPAPCGHADC
jgi:hypothetical protein